MAIRDRIQTSLDETVDLSVEEIYRSLGDLVLARQLLG
jgi:hypothetical protein